MWEKAGGFPDLRVGMNGGISAPYGLRGSAEFASAARAEIPDRLRTCLGGKIPGASGDTPRRRFWVGLSFRLKIDDRKNHFLQ